MGRDQIPWGALLMSLQQSLISSELLPLINGRAAVYSLLIDHCACISLVRGTAFCSAIEGVGGAGCSTQVPAMWKSMTSRKIRTKRRIYDLRSTPLRRSESRP